MVVRRLYTTAELRERGVTRAQLRTAVRNGRLRKVEDSVYAAGPHELTPMDRARAAVVATGGVACGTFAGWLHGLEGVAFDGLHVTVPPTASTSRPGVQRRDLPAERVVVVAGIRCTDALQTLIDLAVVLDDTRWEQALESALRRRMVTVAEVSAAAQRQRGARRVRRVLAQRPAGAAPTESFLETLMVQLVRTIPGLPPPERQHCVWDAHGRFVARVDLAWPELGLFVELDGQHHKDQPVYDARRETAVVAATGWLCGRFTWHEVARIASITRRRMIDLVEQARRRVPLPALPPPPPPPPAFSESRFA